MLMPILSPTDIIPLRVDNEGVFTDEDGLNDKPLVIPATENHLCKCQYCVVSRIIRKAINSKV